MTPFEWGFETKLVYGSGRINEVGSLVAQYGTKAMLVTYTTGAPSKLVLQSIQASLAKENVTVVIYEGVEPNPSSQKIDQAIAQFNKHDCDVVIALGGGSVIDTAKFIAATAFSGGKSWDYINGQKGVVADYNGAYPIISVPTISAAGSETNCAGIIKNSSSVEKYYKNSTHFLPKVAIVDPQLLTSVPLRLTQDSCIGIFSHLIEHYLSSTAESEFADRMAEGMILCLKDNLDKVLYDLENIEVRGQLALCSIFGWSGSQALGRLGTVPLNSIGMPLSAHYDLAHSRAMVILIPAYLAHFSAALPHRWAKLARRCFGVTETDDIKAAEMLSSEVAKWFKSTHAFLTLGDIGIPKDKFDCMAGDVVRNYNKDNRQLKVGTHTITKQDVLTIYKLSS